MEKFKAPALAKGLDIIDLIRENGPLSFNEIQAYTLDNPASLSRYLHTLIAKDYLFKNNQQKYALGLKLMSLSDTKSLWPKLKRHIKPYMKELNETFDITILLIAYTGGSFKVIDKIIAENNLGMMAEGTTYPNTLKTLWTNHFYKTDMDFSAEEVINTNTNYEESITYIANHVKDYGYMRNHSLSTNIIRYGFPIRYNNHVIATIGTGTFAHSISDEAQTKLVTYMLDAIKKLEATLK